MVGNGRSLFRTPRRKENVQTVFHFTPENGRREVSLCIHGCFGQVFHTAVKKTRSSEEGMYGRFVVSYLSLVCVWGWMLRGSYYHENAIRLSGLEQKKQKNSIKRNPASSQECTENFPWRRSKSDSCFPISVNLCGETG